jgi:hypothetical protein
MTKTNKKYKKNLDLEKASEYGLDFAALDLIANNAVKSIKKTYSFLGCFTFEDLKNIAWTGILSAVSQSRFISVKNKAAYCFSFAKGYCQHELQRKSRVIRTPYSIWSAANRTAALSQGSDSFINPVVASSHLSYSWDNLPEPGTSLEETKYSLDLLQLAGAISSQDYNKILKGNMNVSKTTQSIIVKIKDIYEQENSV